MKQRQAQMERYGILFFIRHNPGYFLRVMTVKLSSGSCPQKTSQPVFCGNGIKTLREQTHSLYTRMVRYWQAAIMMATSGYGQSMQLNYPKPQRKIMNRNRFGCLKSTGVEFPKEDWFLARTDTGWQAHRMTIPCVYGTGKTKQPGLKFCVDIITMCRTLFSVQTNNGWLVQALITASYCGNRLSDHGKKRGYSRATRTWSLACNSSMTHYWLQRAGTTRYEFGICRPALRAGFCKDTQQQFQVLPHGKMMTAGCCTAQVTMEP